MKTKFNVASDIAFVMETDGCEVEVDDIVAGAVNSSDILMMLCEGEIWGKVSIK